MRRRLAAALAGAALLAAGAPDARAQEPGVTIDQGSPSGKEYEIPLESARRAAVPGADASARVVPGERGAAPLFGAGVTKGGARRGGTSRSPGKRSSGGDGAAAAAEPAVVQAAASNPGAPDGGAGSPALIAGCGALVLALGAGAGVLLRRRATRP
jgi:hypothetical protein